MTTHTTADRVGLTGVLPDGRLLEDAPGFLTFVISEESIGNYYQSAESLWYAATQTASGRDYWGDDISRDGWTFEQVESDLRRIIEVMGRDGADGSETLEGALLRQSDREEGEDVWVIPDLLRQGDRIMATGAVGAGKSLFCQQVGVQIASGIHPFTGEPIEPRRVVMIDTENPQDELLARLSALSRIAGRSWRTQNLRFHAIGEALDFTTTEGAELLERWSREASSGLLILGPLYKLTNGDPNDAGTARALLDRLDCIRHRDESNCAILLEAHPTKDGGNGEPTGTAVWKQWPEIGIALRKDGGLSAWREPRRSGVILPTRLEREASWDQRRWPFRSAPALATEPSIGNLETVILEFLADHADEEFSRTKLGERLRSEGETFSNSGLIAAIESLAKSEAIEERQVGRARMLRILRNPPQSSAEDRRNAETSADLSSSGGASLEAPAEEDGADDAAHLGAIIRHRAEEDAAAWVPSTESHFKTAAAS